MLKKLTFTGIDNKVNIEELIELKNKYPLIEFGFLISKNNTNKNIDNRFPSLIILQKFKNKNLNLALHVCGSLASQVIKEGSLKCVKEFMGSYFDLFERVQLNIVGHTAKEKLVETFGKEVIIQTNLDVEKSKQVFELYKGLENITFLTDKSGGKGIDSEFDYFDLDYQGFSGGLNRENILSKKEEIEILFEKDFWMDMESSVRTNNLFDTKKIEEICELIFK